MTVRIDVSAEKGLVQYLETDATNPLMEVSGGLNVNGHAVAIADTIKTIHKPTITPANSKSAPGQGPQPIVFGSTIGLEFDTPATDNAYRIMKIDGTFVGDGSGSDASFHVHWTKGTDVNESGNTVVWELAYTVFDGKSNNINVAPTVVQFTDTYDDTGTTTRIVNRTTNVSASGLIPLYYMGVGISVVTGSTTIASPVLISCDLLFNNYVNE